MRYIFFVCLLGICLLFAEVYRELHTFRMTRYCIRTKKWKGTGKVGKILFLSDLHDCQYGAHNRELLQAVAEEEPALIFLGGDMLTAGRKGEFSHALFLVKALCDIAPVYYAPGNHEQRLKDRPEKYGTLYQQYQAELRGAGVHFLENESMLLSLGENRLRLTGLALGSDSYRRFGSNFVSCAEIEKLVGKPKKDTFQILLSHNPAYTESCLQWGADLILSGHYHGGLVCLPGGRGILTPQFRFFPTYNGEYTKAGNQHVVVSRGLGTHTIHLRLFNPAEVIVLQLSQAR